MITIGVISNKKEKKIMREQLYQTMDQVDIIDLMEKKYLCDFISKLNILLCTSGTCIQSFLSMQPNISDQIFHGIFIMNMDDPETCKILQKYRATVITYGMNPRASVTVSSIDQDIKDITSIQCCIQRKLMTIEGKVIEPQEFSIKIPEPTPMNIQNILGVVTTIIVAGKQIGPSLFHTKTILKS